MPRLPPGGTLTGAHAYRILGQAGALEFGLAAYAGAATGFATLFPDPPPGMSAESWSDKLAALAHDPPAGMQLAHDVDVDQAHSLLPGSDLPSGPPTAATGPLEGFYGRVGWQALWRFLEDVEGQYDEAVSDGLPIIDYAGRGATWLDLRDPNWQEQAFDPADETSRLWDAWGPWYLIPS